MLPFGFAIIYFMLNAHLFLPPHFFSYKEEIFKLKTNFFGLILYVIETLSLWNPILNTVTKLWLTQLHQARCIGKQLSSIYLWQYTDK